MADQADVDAVGRALQACLETASAGAHMKEAMAAAQQMLNAVECATADARGNVEAALPRAQALVRAVVAGVDLEKKTQQIEAGLKGGEVADACGGAFKPAAFPRAAHGDVAGLVKEARKLLERAREYGDGPTIQWLESQLSTAEGLLKILSAMAMDLAGAALEEAAAISTCGGLDGTLWKSHCGADASWGDVQREMETCFFTKPGRLVAMTKETEKLQGAITRYEREASAVGADAASSLPRAQEKLREAIVTRAHSHLSQSFQ